jgi:hypothetical protein
MNVQIMLNPDDDSSNNEVSKNFTHWAKKLTVLLHSGWLAIALVSDVL